MEELLRKLASINLCLESINYNSKSLSNISNIKKAIYIANDIISNTYFDSISIEVTKKSLDALLSTNLKDTMKVDVQVKDTIVRGLLVYKIELANRVIKECINEDIDDFVNLYGYELIDDCIQTLELGVI